ncbi:phage tail tip lysozyme [Herbaspirillum huttiense]|uniref:Phage tail tip lysozyme n=2 Tax=Herbaspirillum huttiense TaxID=863372 RepID=A0AAJ2HIQ9_9BURK|nr:phage tail tip lysozyme [Herbaspirillum huttiense]MDR9839460.1 phage tail tip lysozyme [Herbaspirillum huttiense]
MATIIDALVVTLGLDPKGMVKGAKDSQKALGDVSDSVRKVKNELLTMLAVFTAGVGLKQFTQNTINGAAALGQMSDNLGISTQRLDAWKRAAERAGGSAEGIVSTLKESANEVAKFKMGQASDSTQWFFRMGGNANELRDGNSYLLARARIIADIYKTNPARAALVASQMGISDDQFNLIKQGPAAILKLVDAQEKNSAITRKNAEDAQMLRNKWLDLRDTLTSTGQTVLIALIPTFEKLVAMMQRFAQWVQDHQQDIVKWVDSAVKSLGELIDMLNSGAEALGGWKNVLVALLGLKIASYTASLLSMGAALAGVGKSLGLIGTLGGAALRVLGPLGLLLHSGDLNSGEQEELDWRRAHPNPVGAQAGESAAKDARTAGIIDSLVKKGWTKEQAAGIAANLWQESKFDPSAVGDGGKAYGIAQWHPDRQAAFKRLFKKDIQGSTLEEQLMFLTYEMNQGNEQQAGDKVRAARTAAEAAAAVSRYYERPRDTEAEASKRAAAAMQIDSAYGARNAAATGAMPAGAAASASSAAPAPTTNTSTSETHIGQVTVNTKATDAQGIARDLATEMQRYSMASQANTGLS